ncbi:MAG TPA: hypothetical protein VLZ09_08730, partial [Gaiellaceae bacterium]|nr:hypothetical protein [Gaiellaceae bacterium]
HVSALSAGLIGLAQQLACECGQLRVHEHELGRERPNEGVLIDETNSRSFRRFRVFAMRGSAPRTHYR